MDFELCNLAIDFATSISYEESYRYCFLLLAKYYVTAPSFEDSNEAWLSLSCAKHLETFLQHSGDSYFN